MNSKLTINGHALLKRQYGNYKFQISVFRNEIFIFKFNVSLQPTGKEDVLPTYQLIDKSQTLPEWTTQNLNVISDWIIKETK